MSRYIPPGNFYFAVSIGGGSGIDAGFQEVSGLEVEQEFEEIKEGGMNDWIHRVPARIKYNNLTLKRGMAPSGSGLVSWCQQLFNRANHLGTPQRKENIDVELMNEKGECVRMWSFVDAYPVKWSLDNLNSMESKLAIESIEFAYQFFTVN